MVKLYPSLRVRVNSLAFSIYRKQAAPWRVRHLFSIYMGKFSEENLRVKMPRRAFLPAFQGSASAPLPNGNRFAALPIGARLCLKHPAKKYLP